MSINSDFRDLLKTLNDCSVRYLVAGGYAVMYYTEPRFTKDIDIWVEATPANAQKVWTALATFGAGFVSRFLQQRFDLSNRRGAQSDRYHEGYSWSGF